MVARRQNQGNITVKQKANFHSGWRGGISVLALMAFAGPVLAASAEGDATNIDGADGAAEADTIIVTGQAEQPRLSSGALGTRTTLETPFSIATTGADEIEKLRAHTTADYFIADSSVGRDGGSTYNIHSQWITVRGAAVRTHLYNGVPLRDSQGADTPPEFLEQVQLLKGAGGFLFGFAAPGGVINYITKKATGEPLLNVNLGYQSATLFKQHVDAGGKAGPVAYRINLVQEFGETYNQGKSLRYGGAIALQANLAENLVWKADAFIQRNRLDRAEPSWVVGGNASPFVPSYQHRDVPDPVNGRTRFASDDTYTDGRLWSAVTSLTWQFAPDWSARLSGGRVESNHRLPYERIMLINQEGDYALRLFNGLNIYGNTLASLFVEGKFQTGSIRHEIAAGADWRDSTGTHGQNAATVQPGGNIFDPVPVRWNYDNRRNVEARKTGWDKEESAYISDTVTVFDSVSVLAGIRYTRFHSKAWAWATLAKTSDYETTGVTPTFALLYRPNPGTTLYASYIQALSAGTIVGDIYANVGEILPALTSRQYEAGAKFEQANWSGELAVFRLDRGANLITADNRLVQDGIERYQGVEASGRVKLGEEWTLGLSGTFVDGKHQKATNTWLIGRPLHGTARFNGVASVDYRPGFLPGLGLRGLLRYQGEAAIYNNQAADWTVYTPDVVLATIGGDYGFELGGREVTLRAQVQNLFDTRFWNSGTSTCCYSLSPGIPRIFSLDVKVAL
jgi:iron complex outermembrane receptor protein